MTARIVVYLFAAALATQPTLFAQVADQAATTQRFIDPISGMSLEDAVDRALAQEPSLRSARTQIEVAQGMRRQAGLRPNPRATFEQREEPVGTDNQTTVGIEWPLDLFRKGARVAVAEKEVAAVQSAVADRERLLRSEVRMRYGDVLAAIRDLSILEELEETTRRQHELLRARVEEGATPPLERNLLDVELRRLEAEHLLQTGRAEAALFELKRVLGMKADAPLMLRESLGVLVERESEPSQVANTIDVVDRRADVREAAARVDVADAKIERVRSEGRVDVSLAASYMRTDAGFPQQAFAPGGGLEPVRGLFNYWSAGVVVVLPVLNRNQGEIAAAKAERGGAAAAHEALRLAADAELAAARARDARARQAVRVYSSGARELARQNLTVVSQSYELGRLTVFEVLTEQHRYLDVERAYTETLKAAYEARTALDRALGGVR